MSVQVYVLPMLTISMAKGTGVGIYIRVAVQFISSCFLNGYQQTLDSISQ
jgi:hypothetical protein